MKKIVNFKKFVRSIIVLIFIFFALLGVISSGTMSYGEKKYKTVYAQSGDTLWEISKTQQSTNKYYEGKDIRYIVSDIKQVNGLKQSGLRIGQEIKIPVN